jgi:hypothetical protein
VLINSQESSNYIKDEFGIDLKEKTDKFVYTDEEMSVINAVSYQSEIDSMANVILSQIVYSEAKCLDKIQLNIDTVEFEDIKDSHDIDFLRDEAIRLENIDLEKALRLMELAHRARPDGPHIKNKLMEYRARLVRKPSSINQRQLNNYS